jgi:molybdopterin-guanine dinucleotide biosynthesis protein A/molybdopterin converting factor small subunit
VRTLQPLFGEIVVVAAPGQDLPSLPVKLVRDEIAYQGPVGGIYYGLKASGGEFSFVTSCDVAFLNSRFISYLISQIANYDVVVPYWGERFQPLQAIYRRSVLPLLEAQLERGELRPVYLFDKVRTCRIGEDEIRRFDPDGLSFFNMNTAEDYARALERWREVSRALQPGQDHSVRCSVELFGAARLISKTKEISLSLPEGATLSQVFSVLAEKLPVLVGRVISPDKCGLSRGYACNVNGLDFVRNPTVQVNSGDKIFILSADAGG